MSSVITSNVTSGFIDLATFDEIEKYMYGGPDATAYFVRETRKSTWFTQVPVVLSRAAGNPGFGQDWSVNISRAGDYLLQTWLRLALPSVTLVSSAGNNTLRWTAKLMHNLISECTITFNDLVAARFDNYHLDFWAAFTVPAGKQNGYNNMIGNTLTLTRPYPAGTPIPEAVLNLPLPFFYTRDSGVALPTAALPYNEMRINFSFRDWNQLLVITTPGTSGPSGTLGSTGVPASSADLVSIPQLTQCNVWANYAIVSNDERKRMACAPRDILIEQVQTAPKQTFAPANNPQPSYDIRFSHAIKVLFFAARNKSCASEWSNYTVWSPAVTAIPNTNAYTIVYSVGAVDPIDNTSLIYENTARLASMGSDYYSFVNPYYNAPVIPRKTGYHSYSYSLDFICLDPMGSTNYGKLTNVSIIPTASPGAVAAAQTTSISQANYKNNQTYEFITTAVNNNIIRISGGALGKKGKPRKGRCFKSCGKTFEDKHFNYHFLVKSITC